MKKINTFLLAGIFLLAILALIPSCKKEIYTDADALAAMKSGLQYKNDLEKELLALQLTNQLQIINLQSQLSIKETLFGDSLARIGAKTIVSVQVYDVTGRTADMSGFDVTVNQNGTAVTDSTDANGLVVFPDFVTGTASIVVVKTGFARASGIMNINSDGYYLETTQQAVRVPVFPTESATAKISGILTAQLDLLTEETEIVEGGIVSLNFNDLQDLFDNPSGDLDTYEGLIGIVFDGGFMQTVITGADGKYEFKVPKSNNTITYNLTVSTIQKNQQLMLGDSPEKLDSIQVDTMLTWFGYYPGEGRPVYDYIFDYETSGGSSDYTGLNITIDAPAGGEAPTQVAEITFPHNDSIVVTWNFTTFSNVSGHEFTDITQDPVFVYEPFDADKLDIVTPCEGVANITNGKITSLSMTNGGEYKEYGRYNSPDGLVEPAQASAGVQFKFLEQLSADDLWNTDPEADTTYQTAQAVASVVLNSDDVAQIDFDLTNNPGITRPGVGYTAVPHVVVKFTTGADNDTIVTLSSSKIHLLTGGGISIDSLVLSDYSSLAGFSIESVDISTYKADGDLQPTGAWGIDVEADYTYKDDLTNGFFITNGGLGYKAAPTLFVEVEARTQGDVATDWPVLRIAEAATTIDAEGRIISVSDPVMLGNFQVINEEDGSLVYDVILPDVVGMVQAHARAEVDENGSITDVLLYNEDAGTWDIAPDFSGQGYLTIPEVKVYPVGKTSVETPAVLQAELNNEGRVIDILVVDPGKGYDVRNHDSSEWLINQIATDGASDLQYDIDLGSGWHGKDITIFTPWVP
ncbi:MAG: hypothetical protein NTV31_10535 [Bacteroidia bacterium]|nr:hypothetical protein [Bacteroidia bacterium]